jgi:hypothetical protein
MMPVGVAFERLEGEIEPRGCVVTSTASATLQRAVLAVGREYEICAGQWNGK